MIAPSHLLTAQTAYLAVSLATGHPPAIAEAFTAAACGLLPDLDKRQSIIGRLFPLISESLDYHIGHRTLTHSLLFLGGIGLALWYVLPFGWWLAVITGASSHVFADMLTPSPEQLGRDHYRWGRRLNRRRPFDWREVLCCTGCEPL